MLIEFDEETDTICIKYKKKIYEVAITLDGELDFTKLEG
jgi:hypothetical protein